MKIFSTHKKTFIISAIVGFLMGTLVGGYFYFQTEPTFGAPVFTVQRSIIPESSATYYLGTSTPSTIRWANIFTTDLNISGTCTGCSGFSYPFPSNATSTLLTFNGGLISPASSTMQLLSIGFSTTTGATTTDLYVSNTLNVVGTLDVDGLTSALVLTGAGGVFAEYGGSSCAAGSYVLSLSALGVATCAVDPGAGFGKTWELVTATALSPTTTPMSIIINSANSSSTISHLNVSFATSTQATSTNLRVSYLGSFANLFIDTSGYLEIPRAASTTWGAKGTIQNNDATATSGIAFYNRTDGTSGILTNRKQITYPENAASTTVPTAGTTTVKVWTFKKGSGKLVKILCEVHSRKVPMTFGTSTVRHVQVVSDTTLYGEFIVCTNSRMNSVSGTSTVQQGNANSINDDDGSIANGVYPLGGELLLERGNWTGTADDLIVTFIFDEGI